jgi:tRNA threonylcarbamoyladenosine biosynthesis protein TsaE
VLSVDITSQSVEQTIQIGTQLGKLLRAGDVICLSGDLGAGKTALTKGIAAGWGALELVTSPTFTLIHEHRRVQDQQVLYHLDSYRLEGAGDAWGIGLEDMLYGDHVVVIEWPEKIEAALPPERLWIALSIAGDSERCLNFTTTGNHYQQLIDRLHHDIKLGAK